MRSASMLRGILALVAGAAVAGLMVMGSAVAAESHTSKPFTGAKVNGGTVTHTSEGGKQILTLSDDFKDPMTPDPHWQVVDSHGNVYLLERLMIKGDKLNKSITLPSDIKDVAKVQIWCAFAEVVLGETSFDTVVK